MGTGIPPGQESSASVKRPLDPHSQPAERFGTGIAACSGAVRSGSCRGPSGTRPPPPGSGPKPERSTSMKKEPPRILSVLLGLSACLLGLVLTACGQESETEEMVEEASHELEYEGTDHRSFPAGRETIADDRGRGRRGAQEGAAAGQNAESVGKEAGGESGRATSGGASEAVSVPGHFA